MTFSPLRSCRTGASSGFDPPDDRRSFYCAHFCPVGQELGKTLSRSLFQLTLAHRRPGPTHRMVVDERSVHHEIIRTDKRFHLDVGSELSASGKRSGPGMEGTLKSTLGRKMARLSTNSSWRRLSGRNQPGLIGSKVFSTMSLLRVRKPLRDFRLIH